MAPYGDPAKSTRAHARAAGTLSRLLEELAAAPEDDPGAQSPIAPGTRLGRFQVSREIGRGGFGTVYAALDPELGREVALKTIRAGPARRGLSPDAVRREAEAIARLEHPSIVTVFDVGSGSGRAFLVMELLRGETLAQRLTRGPLAPGDALSIAEQIAGALAHAHSRGVLHRDLKPANVFLTDDGRVKLLDFGIAHLLGRTDAAGSGGTPAYMAPEQVRGERCDARTDVYAAGLILAETLGGYRPTAAPRGDAGDPDFGGSAPGALAELTRAALAADPERRPRDGIAWLRALQEVRSSGARRQRLRRGALVAAAATALGLAVAGLTTWRVWRSRFPSGPTAVVVGDVRNETGDPELEGFSELIATSLRQSHRVRVLTRDVVTSHLRQLGESGTGALDEATARELGRRARARAVLLGSIRSVGGAFALEVRALDPERDEYAFTVLEQVRGKDAVLELVDRTALSLRRALEEPDEEVRAAEDRVGDVVTRSLAAYQAYVEGVRCRERAADGCIERFERAVALDPTFAMAHYELAVATFLGPDFRSRGLPAIREALRHVSRAPESERIKIRAFAAWAEGRESDADALYREALERHPDDFLVASSAAFFLMTRDEPHRALPALRRAVELAPAPGLAMEGLVDALGALGLYAEIADVERRAAAIVAAGGHPRALDALVAARMSLGDAAGALDAIRGATSRASPAGGRAALEEYTWQLRIHRGDLSVEPEIRPHCGYEPTYQLTTLLGLAGRRAEALRVLEDGERPECPPRTAEEWRDVRDSLFFHAALARFAAGHGDGDRARRHARRALQRNATLAPHLAVYLAYVGDEETAQELARGLAPGSPRRRAYEAVALWRRGDLAAARDILRELAAKNPWSSTPHVLPPSFLYGELAAEMGDDAAAIAALERFGSLYFYRLDFWSWAYPRSLYLLARSYERSGDTARARDRIGELLALWRSADSDLPLVVEARALGERLGAGAQGR